MIAKIIRVSDVEPQAANVSGPSFECRTDQHWISKKMRTDGSSWNQLLTYVENQPVAHHCEAPFFGAFLTAYNTHKDVVLSPDDLWHRICLQFSTYVRQHNGELRSRLVPFEGKKTLTVETEESQEMHGWDTFLNETVAIISLNANPGIVESLQSDFSTTGTIERLLSSAVVLDCFQSYFTYRRRIPQCGIRKVVFLGTLLDWQRLSEKLQALRKYAVTSEWSDYIDNLLPILEHFVRAYEGDVDRDFWDKVMDYEQGRRGSGSVSYVSGWILALYGMSGRVPSRNLRDPHIDVPVELDNKLTTERKMVSIVGGFGGVSEVQGEVGGEGYHGYRPQMSFVVCTNGADLNKM